jgi:hypothetical protein
MRQSIDKKGKLTIARFTASGMADLLDYASGPTPSAFKDRSSRRKSQPTWYGSASFEEALNLAKNGWPKGARKLGAALEALQVQSPIAASAPVIAYDVAGAYCDTVRAACGEIDHMVDEGEVETIFAPIVHMVINSCVSAYVSAEKIAQYGAALLACICALEQSGARVALHSAWVGESFNNKGLFCFATPVKRPEEPLDIDAIAFVTGHASYLRRVLFSVLETSPEMEKEGMAGNYGTPKSPDDARADMVGAGQIPRGAVFLPGPQQIEPVRGMPENLGYAEALLIAARAGALGAGVALPDVSFQLAKGG